MIYFDLNKNAYAFIIDSPLCIVEEEEWHEFSHLTLGEEYDVTQDGIIDLRETEEYKQKQFEKEQQRIAMLNLTGADVERGIYKAGQKYSFSYEP